MAYGNFVPTVWNETIERELERLCVFAENCNRQYDGDVQRVGDTVRILGVARPSITTTTDKSITLSDPEDVEDTSVEMKIRQISHFNFKVDDIDKRQAESSLLDALVQESAEGVANEMDKHIASMSSDKLAVLDASAGNTLTSENILGKVDEALQKLYENDVKQSTEVTMTVPPWFYMMLKSAYQKLDTDNSEMMKNGRVGRYGSVVVKMSNNVAKTGDYSLVQLKTDRAIAFVNPLTHTEAYRPEKKFSDAVKGFVLYQAKLVRPKEMIVLKCKA